MLPEIAVFFFRILWRAVSLTWSSLAVNPPLVDIGAVGWQVGSVGGGSVTAGGESIGTCRAIRWISGGGASDRVRLI